MTRNVNAEATARLLDQEARKSDALARYVGRGTEAFSIHRAMASAYRNAASIVRAQS